jgi:hypothetical protein
MLFQTKKWNAGNAGRNSNISLMRDLPESSAINVPRKEKKPGITDI